MRHPLSAFTVLIAAVALAACGVKPEAPEVNPTDMPKGPGLLSGESGNLLDAFNRGKSEDETGGKIGVSIYLWRAALDSVDFMPLLTADSQGGVIITDWYSGPSNPQARAKVNILITGKSLQANALKVTLFKQELKGGTWTDVPVEPATVRQLEDAILTKARALRVQAMATK